MFTRKPQKNVFIFHEINVNVSGRQVLRDVSGAVSGGEILAIVGGKECGKTTLAATLAGLVSSFTGDITLDGNPLTSQRTSTNMALVTDQDFFLPTLTVKETLEFASRLRQSASVAQTVREERLKELRETLRLVMFENVLVQFTNVDIKRRLSIACELAFNPAVLIIDEPFSGTDFKTSHNLMKDLKRVAEDHEKAIIILASNMSSVVFQMCAKALFLHDGRVSFLGRPNELAGFLKTAGFPCSRECSAIDHMLSLLCNENLSDLAPVQPRLIEQYYLLRNTDLRIDELPPCQFRKPSIQQHKQIGQTDSIVTVQKDKLSAKYKAHCATNHTNSISRSKTLSAAGEVSETCVMLDNGDQMYKDEDDDDAPESHLEFSKWRTSFWNQVRVLTARNFVNSRRRILFPISVIQNGYILLLCVLVWWQPPRNDARIMDRLGLFFFTTVQWAFFALLDVILTFPKELKVIGKERRNNLYRVSAYCISKTLSEVPLAIIQPAVYLAVIYWVANLNGPMAFLASLGVLVLNVVTAQSIGLFVGVALNPPWNISVVSLGLLSMMLLGGAFNKPPSWLQWAKYLSYFYYGLNSFINLEFSDAAPIPCSERSMTPPCGMMNPLTNQTITEFPANLVLEVQGITWPIWQYLLVLLVIMVVTRCLWYYILKRRTMS